MEAISKSRNAYWDNVKFFTILSVVVFHFLFGIIDEEPLARAIYVFIYSFHMPTFLFVSGLFLKYDKNHGLRIDKVVFYIALAYIFKFLIWAEESALGNATEWHWVSTSNIPWYLIVTAEYIVFVYIIRKISPKIVFPVSVIISLVAGYVGFIGDQFCISKFIVFFPFFYAGYCLTPQKAENFIKNKKVKIFAISFFIVFGIISLIFTDEVSVLRSFFSARISYEYAGYPVFGIFLRILQYVISSIMIVGWCSLIGKKQMRFFTKAGSKTLSVYFWHYFLVPVIAYIGLDKTLVDFSALLGIACLFAIGFIVTCLSSLQLFSYPLNFISMAITKVYNKICASKLLKKMSKTANTK